MKASAGWRLIRRGAEGSGDGERTGEKALAAEAAALPHAFVGLGMQRVEQGALNQVRWPDHGWGRDQEPSSNPPNGEPDELCGHHHEPLVPKVVVLICSLFISNPKGRSMQHRVTYCSRRAVQL